MPPSTPTSPADAALSRAFDEITILRRLDSAARARLAAAGRLLDLERGERLFEEGRPARWLYVVVSGRVKVFRSAPSGREVILEIFGPGDPVGAVATLEGFPFPASAEAAETSQVLELERDAFLSLLESDPAILRGVLSGFSLRLLEMSRRIVELSAGRVEVRLAQLFLRLAEESAAGSDSEGGPGLTIARRLTRQELADLCGTTVETTIRVLSRWSRQGVVETTADGFRIPDPAALAAIADS